MVAIASDHSPRAPLILELKPISIPVRRSVCIAQRRACPKTSYGREDGAPAVIGSHFSRPTSGM
jgi:hypothetical protein